jgi:D-sedoheptulose 7-phosphate isomerase
MDIDAFLDAEFDAHAAVTEATRNHARAPFAALVAACRSALDGGNKILFFGNGGSAADAQHLAAELVVRYRLNRAPLAAIALTTDTSTLTAAANDFSFDEIFERQLRALGRAGDVAIGLTTSGNSPNVLRALSAAREIGVVPAALAGNGGGRLTGIADPLVVVPSDVTARIQEMHILLGHMLCDLLERPCAR